MIIEDSVFDNNIGEKGSDVYYFKKDSSQANIENATITNNEFIHIDKSNYETESFIILINWMKSTRVYITENILTKYNYLYFSSNNPK